MKKFFFSLVAAMMAATATFAQSTLVATLTHDGTATMYYGAYALRDAHEAAASGDVINLSGGSFQATDITKAVTLRGAGIDAQDPTVIVNDFKIDIPTTDAGQMSMEGIRCEKNKVTLIALTKAYFLKCFFYDMVCEPTGSGDNIKYVMLANCKVRNGWRTTAGYKANLQFVNSLLSSFYNSNKNAAASFHNCIIGGTLASAYAVNCQFINSIMNNRSGDSGETLDASSVESNCVAIGYVRLLPNLSTFEEVFKTFKGDYSDIETFELTDAAKAKFLGNDGKEIGLYGGLLPYSSATSYPQITKMDVNNKTTADGKLSMEIDVNAAQ